MIRYDISMLVIITNETKSPRMRLVQIPRDLYIIDGVNVQCN